MTKRARLWLTRGMTIGVLVILLVLAAATWIQSGAIAASWLVPSPTPDDGTAVLVEYDGSSVLLSDGDDLDRPGIWGITGRDGFMQLGEVLEVGDAGVRRAVLAASGSIRLESEVRFVRAAHLADNPPVALDEVLLEGPLGIQPAWSMAGSDDTWIILVHGNEGTRSETLRILSAVQGEGYPALIPSYRNDPGGPVSDGGQHGFGRHEWQDLEAAVEYAIAAGARDLVLIGYGSGGSIIGTFLYQSGDAERVVAVILDAPVLSLGIMVDEAWAPTQVPGFIVGSAKAIAAFRYGVDWAALDHVRRADEWTPPTLILHGREDSDHPLRASAEFAAARPDGVLLLTFPDAGPGASWNSDPVRYEEAVRGFLRQHAAGESSLEVSD